VSGAFDGAGRPYREPTLRAVLLLAAAIVLGVAGVWLAMSWAMNAAGGPPEFPATPSLTQSTIR